MTKPEPLPAPSTTRPLRPRNPRPRVRASTTGATASRRPTAVSPRSHTYPPDGIPTTQQPVTQSSRPSMDPETSSPPVESPPTLPSIQPLFEEGEPGPADLDLQFATDQGTIAAHASPVETIGSEAGSSIRNGSGRKRKRPSSAEKRAVAARVGESLADAEEGIPSMAYPARTNAIDSEDEELTVRTSLRALDEDEFEVGSSRPRPSQNGHGAGAGHTLPSFADSFSELSWHPGSSTSFSIPLNAAGPSGTPSWNSGPHAPGQQSRGHARADTSPFDLNPPYDPVGFDAPVDFRGGNGSQELRFENRWRVPGSSAAGSPSTSRHHAPPRQGAHPHRSPLTHDQDDQDEDDEDITLISPTTAAKLHFSASVPPHPTSPKAKAKARTKGKDKAAAPQSLPVSPPAPAPAPPTPAPEPLHAYTCPICLSPPTAATLTPCGHILCGECLFTAVNTAVMRTGVGGLGARCPVCRAGLPGWDGRGGGVVGLNMRVMISL